MKNVFPIAIEQGRLRQGEFGTEPGKRYGAFFVKCPSTGERLKIIVGSADAWESEGMDGEPWDHVSVSCERRCPWWMEMCWVKDQFFEESELVVQYHPPKQDYINKHDYVLHLWKPSVSVIPVPPKVCV